MLSPRIKVDRFATALIPRTNTYDRQSNRARGRGRADNGLLFLGPRWEDFEFFVPRPAGDIDTVGGSLRAHGLATLIPVTCSTKIASFSLTARLTHLDTGAPSGAERGNPMPPSPVSHQPISGFASATGMRSSSPAPIALTPVPVTITMRHIRTIKSWAA
jgi:hypothetical protein